MILKRKTLSVFLILLFFACSRDRLVVDISDVNVKATYVNLDSLLHNANDQELLNFYHELQTGKTEIYEYQIGYCLQIGRVSDSSFLNSIHQFRKDKGILELESDLNEKFNTAKLNSIKLDLNDGLKHLKFHFPNGKFPKSIVFMNSLFQSNAFSTQQEIGIGIERYLGYKNEFIQKLPSEPFYDWIKKGMEEVYLTRDVMCSWIMTHYIPEEDNSLVESMIRWGKVLYLTEATIPNAEKRIVMRYTQAQYKWAEENELAFWKYLVKEKLLFKNSGLEKANYLNEGPYTIGLPDTSSNRMGQFLGWKMVKNYMDNNDVSLEELIKTPYNTILQEYDISE